MVRRVCRELGNKRNIIVINDEAHHCYRRRADDDGIKLVGDERKQAEKREEEARVWISGLEAVRKKLGIRAIYDLSATPFFLRAPDILKGHYSLGCLGFLTHRCDRVRIVKVPRVPVADDSMTSELPTYRNIWIHIRDHLPRKAERR